METKEELYDLRTKISQGLKIAHKKMIEFKKFKKTPIVISSNGKIIEVQPNDI